MLRFFTFIRIAIVIWKYCVLIITLTVVRKMMYLSPLSVVAAGSAALLFGTSLVSAKDDSKVEIKLYAESKCPFCQMFAVQILPQVVNQTEHPEYYLNLRILISFFVLNQSQCESYDSRYYVKSLHVVKYHGKILQQKTVIGPSWITNPCRSVTHTLRRRGVDPARPT